MSFCSLKKGRIHFYSIAIRGSFIVIIFMVPVLIKMFAVLVKELELDDVVMFFEPVTNVASCDNDIYIIELWRGICTRSNKALHLEYQ